MSTKVLGFVPETGFEEGLKKTIGWRKNKSIWGKQVPVKTRDGSVIWYYIFLILIIKKRKDYRGLRK